MLDDIINTVNELVFWAVDRLEQALSDATPELLGFKTSPQTNGEGDGDDTALAQRKQSEIDAGIVQLESLLNATVDQDFDKVELYMLRNILTVGTENDPDLAKYVQLDHYKDLNIKSITSKITPEEVQLQRRKLHETQKLNTMLREEETRNAAVIEQLESLLGVTDDKKAVSSPFSFLVAAQQQAQKTKQPVVSEHMQNVIAQLPAIRQYLTQLQESLVALRSKRTAQSNDPAALKRRQYLDGQAAKVLARQGLEPSHAESSKGPRVSKEEVENIESIIQAVAGDER